MIKKVVFSIGTVGKLDKAAKRLHFEIKILLSTILNYRNIGCISGSII